MPMSVRIGHLRFREDQSLGRRYPEPPHPYRREFQRDRDRIIHSRAFRRLEDKTQVFRPRMSDHFRTRLTHTMEVTQIARTAAAALGLNEDLAEGLALVHDIGHPPFGHAGERELDRIMRRYGRRFDHNRHALRIVESFEIRYALFPGLNLTFEVREGILKHSRELDDGDPAEYLPHLRPPLEAQLIDLCDEIAYNTADLDDGLAAGLFPFDEAAGAVDALDVIREQVETRFPGAPERVRFNESLRELINLLVSGLIQGTAESVRQTGVEDADQVRRMPERLASFAPEAKEACGSLKNFLHARLYGNPALVEEREGATSRFEDLFDLYLKQPELLPEEYRAHSAGEPEHVMVLDYIAGMTDSFFRRTCGQLLTVSN